MMLIQTHGDDAETVAASRLADAEAEGHLGNTVVWEEVQKLIPKVRAEQSSKL